jgi:hypothetical protein
MVRCGVYHHTPVLLALGRLKQEDLELKASPGHRVRPYLKKE